MVVDLPAPFGPSRPTHEPNGTSRSSPATAVIGPKRFTTPLSLIADSPATPPHATQSWFRAARAGYPPGGRLGRLASHRFAERSARLGGVRTMPLASTEGQRT